MSYWNESPGPFWRHFFQSINPFAFPQTGVLDKDIVQKKRNISPPQGGSLIILQIKHARDIANLLRKHYEMFPRCRIILSEERIRRGFLYDKWLGVGFVSEKTNELIGCIFSRSLGDLHVGNNIVPNTGLVDFFCVHRDWRGKGIASFLLQELTYLTATVGRIVHIFIKEGLPLSPLPPIWTGNYIWRNKKHIIEKYLENKGLTISSIEEVKNTSLQIPEMSIRNLPSGPYLPGGVTGDSQIYVWNSGKVRIYVCLTDTYHCSVPEGKKIGEINWVLSEKTDIDSAILLAEKKSAVETLVDSSKYDIILMDSTIPHLEENGWIKDSAYGLYLFNCNPPKFFNQTPILTLCSYFI